MAAATVTATVSDFWDDSKRIHVVGKLAIGASPATYSTGGIACDFNALLSPVVPGVDIAPSIARVEGIAGFKYEIDYVNKKLLIRSSAGLASHTHDLFLNNADVVDGATTRVNAGANLLGANTGADITVTGVADTTGHGGILPVTAGTGGANPELGNNTAIPAGVSGDTITFEATFKKLQ